MRCFLFFFLAAFLPGFALAAHASTITAGSYTLQGAFAGGYSVTGTVTFDAGGTATAANLLFNDPNVDNSGLPYFNQVASTGAYNGLSQNYLGSSRSSGQIALILNTASDANGYFDLCLGGAQCGTTGGTTGASTVQIYGFYNSATGVSNPGLGPTNFSSGYLVGGDALSTVVTAEPRTLILLVTGVLGLTGISALHRRRELHAARQL